MSEPMGMLDRKVAFEFSAARIPSEDLDSLARFRDREDIQLAPDVGGNHLWVRWPIESFDVAMAVFGISRVELFRSSGLQWYRAGSRIPIDFSPPDHDRFCSIQRLLIPSKIEWDGPSGAVRPMTLLLAPSDVRRATSAMKARASDLIAWAECTPRSRLASKLAAIEGEMVWLLGADLPWAPGPRWWGDRILCPLGLEPVPRLSEEFFVQALGLADGESAVLERTEVGTRASMFTRSAFDPLTLSGLRMIARNGGAT
jgi:MoxR-vWA-beta-propeller ternary system domain bpX2